MEKIHIIKNIPSAKMGRKPLPIEEKKYVSRKEALRYFNWNCARCKKYAVHVHHKDKNTSNNKLENLEPLCKECHYLEHEKDLSHNIYKYDLDSIIGSG